MIDLSQAQHIESYIYGTFIIVLISGIIYLANQIRLKDKEIKSMNELTNKCMELIGTNTEVVRSCIAILNKLNDKI